MVRHAMKYYVELDFRGTFRVSLNADSAREAYTIAKRILVEDDQSDFGDIHVDRIDSFQVQDESSNHVSIDYE